MDRRSGVAALGQGLDIEVSGIGADGHVEVVQEAFEPG
jgi:hypothetical protein